MEDSERLEKGQILVRAIIEMLGAPKVHIENTLKDYVKGLKEDRDLHIVKEHYDEAEPQGKLFVTFTEIEIWFKNIDTLLSFCINSLPSSIEIIEPSSIQLKTNDFASMINNIQGKLHHVDMSLKSYGAENQILRKNNQALVKNIVVLCIKTGNDTIKAMEKHTGIPEKQLVIILDDLVKRGSINKEGSKYTS